MTRCCCGNVLDAEKPKGFTCTRKPCLCDTPARLIRTPLGTLGVIMRGDHPRDPKRAALGLPDRTPLEKSILKGTFNE